MLLSESRISHHLKFAVISEKTKEQTTKKEEGRMLHSNLFSQTNKMAPSVFFLRQLQKSKFFVFHKSNE